MVYRNEDTRWGFPFYFKFGSANLQAQVQALGNENKLVQIKYYGWRMTMFDEYRNAVSVKEISGDVTPSHPILSWVFYAFLLVTLSFQYNLYAAGLTAKISVSQMGRYRTPSQFNNNTSNLKTSGKLTVL